MKSLSSQFSRRAFLGTASATMLAAPTILRAQATTVLNFSSWMPRQNLIAENLFDVWVDDISRVTDGRVKIEYLPEPLGPPPAHLDVIQSGAADIGYALHGYSGDKFQRAKIGQFSFLGDTYSASHAFSKVYGQLLEADQEHDKMELLGLFQHGPGLLMLRDKVIRTPADYEGLRISTPGGYIESLITELGAVNVGISPFDIKSSLLDGSIDGVAIPYEGATTFGFVEDITFISELPNGYYNATWFLGMSEQGAAKLPAEDLALVKEYSANTVHVLAAKAFDYADYLAKEAFQAAGTTIEIASQELIDHVKSVADPYEQAWAANLAADGFDGERALAFTRRITSGN